MTNNANTTETNNNVTTAVKEESTMKNNINTTATNNSATVVKEEFTMEALVKRITENKIQDKDYIDRLTLKTIMNEQFGFNFNNRSTRTEMVEALMNKYKDSLKVADETDDEDDNNAEDETTMTPVAEVVSVGDLSITSDRIYHDDTIIEKTVPVKVNNPAPVPVYDAKTLTYMLMHKIGDHALSNSKKGFGTTISAKILCAFIVEVASLNDIEPIDRLYVPTGKKDKYGNRFKNRFKKSSSR